MTSGIASARMHPPSSFMQNVMKAGYNDEQQLIASVAWLYYHEGMTQDAIASRMGMTRARVIRTLNDARSLGIVRISVDYGFADCLQAEHALKQKYGLLDARVIPGSDENTRHDLIGQAAGSYLDQLLKPGNSLAIGWGRTVDAALPALTPRRGKGHTVVSLVGGLPAGHQLNPYDTTARFARVLDATSYYVTTPMFVSSTDVRDLLLAEPTIEAVLNKAASADIALISATDLGLDSKNLVYQVIDEALRHSLLEAGIVGDTCGIYLDAKGQPVDHPLTQRMIIPPLEGLLQIPKIVLASGGMDKVAILHACLLKGLGNILVTDMVTANALLER